jgi:hypothetical protein
VSPPSNQTLQIQTLVARHGACCTFNAWGAALLLDFGYIAFCGTKPELLIVAALCCTHGCRENLARCAGAHACHHLALFSQACCCCAAGKLRTQNLPVVFLQPE